MKSPFNKKKHNLPPSLLTLTANRPGALSLEMFPQIQTRERLDEVIPYTSPHPSPHFTTHPPQPYPPSTISLLKIPQTRFFHIPPATQERKNHQPPPGAYGADDPKSDSSPTEAANKIHHGRHPRRCLRKGSAKHRGCGYPPKMGKKVGRFCLFFCFNSRVWDGGCNNKPKKEKNEVYLIQWFIE